MTTRTIASLAALFVSLGFCMTASLADELVAYKVVDDSMIEASLTGKSGDPKQGRKVAIDRKLGNCLACHSLPIPEQQFHGETGPDLAGVGSRLTPGELRLRVVDPKVVNPETMMPAFYRVKGLNRVMKDFAGKPILTAEQVEDVVAYLVTLKED
ncbi:MAG: sulfur oxidation c-type cytochrome SoxX [Kiloniellales bacterium]|nr:sulfur oxidation c-type cytochrome SoxX [Kiloniellales bacterium]